MKNIIYKRYDEELFRALYSDLEIAQNLLSPYAVKDKYAIRRRSEKFHVARPNYVKDIDRIINCRYFNRYTDKTQVFSFYHNDDITRRALHVQLVSRIARNIGRMLKLNQDLIEAIALGHDLGHPPFAHVGERILSNILYKRIGNYFHHNVQSVRILDKILQLNLSLQTLDGILSHNGEKVSGKYYPGEYKGETVDEIFLAFEDKIDLSISTPDFINTLIPSTLEGCVVRLSDIIAYIGKDRQDAVILGMEIQDSFQQNELLGITNAEFITSIITDIIANSYNKDYIMLSDEYADALYYEMNVNYKKIYEPQNRLTPVIEIELMYEKLFDKLYIDLINENVDSPIFKHHLNKIFAGYKNDYIMMQRYLKHDKHQIVTDYLASMTDDYFLKICEYLYPGTININYHSYFNM